MPRRRRMSRSFAGKKGGRKFFWLRFTPFSLTVREASTATHSDMMLTESDWANPQAQLNDTQRGGARLERIIIDYGLSVDGEDSFWAASGEGNIALIPEFMVWKQSDQFATIVTSSASFDATRDNQRVLMDEVPSGRREFTNYDTSATPVFRSIRSVQGFYETKSKVRLADGALGIAYRGSFDEGASSLLGFTDWVRPTILMSIP